jgi:hypothetical protein
VFVLALRAETWARGPDRTHHRVVPALTLRPSCRACVRVVFFSVVRRVAHRVWPIWTCILGADASLVTAPRLDPNGSPRNALPLV